MAHVTHWDYDSLISKDVETLNILIEEAKDFWIDFTKNEESDD